MDALYGIKFLAFLGIFFQHLCFPRPTGAIFTTFFFVFAGFITAYSFNRKRYRYCKKNIKKFYLDKLIKNYPIYIATLIISLPFVKTVEGLSWGVTDVLIHGSMLQTIIPRGDKTFMFNGLSWFLVDLMIFYLLAPLLYRFVQKYKIKHQNSKMVAYFFLIVIVEILFSLSYTNNIETYGLSWWLFYISPISRILNLLFGFFFGLWFYKNEKKLRKKVAKVPKAIMTILELLSLVNVLFCAWSSGYLPSSFALSGTHHLFVSFSLILLFGLSFGYISDFFKSKVLVYLGKLSLPCYMTHQLVINYLVFCCFCRPWYNQEISFIRNLFDGTFILLLTLCLSDALQRYALVPATRYLQNKFIKR